ncbi:MAG: hypothetical protein J5849_01465 [Clostridia bacterium]|nr:hypothetical protein [Clostridia bacterium]
MAEEMNRREEWIGGIAGGDVRGKLMRVLPLLAGEDGKKLTALLYLTGSDPAKLRAAFEKAVAGDARELREIMANLAREPEGEKILARLLSALRE